VKRSYGVFGATGALILVAAIFFRPNARADQPRIPSSDAEVLEHVLNRSSDPRARKREDLRRALVLHPDDLATATALAKVDIGLSRERSDPRYLGYAQAALAPWWDLPSPPVEVLVLRATIRQSMHDFDSALVDLDRAVALAPNDPQVWITRAVVLTVRGRYDEAKQSCLPLRRLAPDLVFTVCETSIDAVTGNAAPAYDRLATAIAQAPQLSEDEREWAVSNLGEIALRLGRDADAEKHFRAALAIDPEDPYAIAALTDLMIDLNRPDEAIKLVAQKTDNDGLLLRLAIAEKKARASEAAVHADLLASRIDASKLRGDVVHRREQARFELEIRGDSHTALDLARANWDVQKEAWDARIFLQSAVAEKKPAAAAEVVAFVREHHWQDPRITSLADALVPLDQGAHR
jgi:Tfp pilus assembly protein PilF